MLVGRMKMLLACGTILLGATPSLAQQVPDDFRVELVYKVPDIEHPSSVTCDDDGNLYVGEDPMDMRGPSTELIDRIVRIHWNEEGGPPTKTIFCDKLSAVFGMVWYQDALYVMNAPYYTMLKDTDGDGIADVRKNLADSFGHAPGLFGLNNHVPSGMRLGIDGFVYVALGDKGLPKAVGADGSTITLEGGGVFRMRPDASKLEVVSRGIRNNMDVALDRFDNIFSFDNDDDFGWWTRIIHHVPTGYYGYPYDYRSQRNAFLPPVGEFGSGTACGGACYRESAWPSKYQGNAFFCDWGDGKIEHYRMTRKGASFEAHVEDFMLGDDSGDFRPIDLCFSPDGKHMYVADWNLAGGGKPNRVGRLFRVTYVGDQVPAEPARASDADSLKAQIRSLGHPSHHERMRAQQRLAAWGEKAVRPVSNLLSSNARDLVKVHAIWTQDSLIGRVEGFDPSTDWIASLQDPAVEVRRQAARALGNRRMKTATAGLTDALGDADAAVRMQAAIALGRIGNASSAHALLKALGEADLVARHTMIEAIRAIGNWKPALSVLRTGDSHTRMGVIQTADGVFAANAVKLLDRWFREAKDPMERAAALRALAKVHRKADPYTGGWWGGKAAGGKPARPQKHRWMETELVLKAINTGLRQKLPQVRLAALETLRDVEVPETRPWVRHMVEDDPDQEVRLAAIRWLSDAKDTEIIRPLLELAADQQTSDTIRQAAVQAVAAIDGKSHSKELAQIALSDESPVAVVSVALDALAAATGVEARKAIIRRLSDRRSSLRAKAIEVSAQAKINDVVDRIVPALKDSDASVQRAALSALSVLMETADADTRTEVMIALASSPDPRALSLFVHALLDKEKKVSRSARETLISLGDSIRADLRTLHDRNELSTAARKELNDVFASNSNFAFLKQAPAVNQEPAAYAKYATKHRGNPSRGQQLFANINGIGCAKCHVVGGSGAENIGPDLLGIGAKYPRQELIRAVLEPSNRILIDFEMVIVVTEDGKIHQGMIRSETAEQIELVTPDGKVVLIRADEIDLKKTSNLSPMPNGLAQGMTLENFADIIAYLESLGERAEPGRQGK